ncbi:glycerol-3-phosphate acyltransferase [Novosphingobium endophyticum]|uniref:Glycerol-3-phosphate acyltransferase n=1 Tax=Novosphingobium endophyticum TaxID=1955250 RepID=A0A916TTP6_9SPHN|nr:glycerol-3-phosphate 1-O-acyltransferase [Novosphingobium endophyticum]GGC05689.1 glycerol-3-phosphate acyltransferase [Novosphingobium endophyticum]
MATQSLQFDTQAGNAARQPEITVYLAGSQGKAERELLDRWLTKRGVGGTGATASAIHYERSPDAPTPQGLVVALTANDNLDDHVMLAPVRVIWRVSKASGQNLPRWRDALLLRNPRNPGEREKARLAAGDEGRWQIIEGRPATIGELRERWRLQSGSDTDGNPSGFARFVARQAELALEHAEYQARGARYKLPRVHKEDVAATPRFREGITKLAAELGLAEDQVSASAMECLEELRTAHDHFVLDLAAKAFHRMYARAYGEVDIDLEQIEMLRRVFASHPVILLPSHKTNLDSPVLESVLAQHRLPPPTLFAGINMSYWPVGPIMRRAGRVFLRRNIGDNPVYKFALREWLGYLIEKRFNLEWFPEGTRSRTGKLLPPKLGLLAYAAEAYRQGRLDDLMLVPISIIYDQAIEVSDFAREALGETKKAENLAWMLKSQKKANERQGRVYMRFGEPLSMRAALGPPDPQADGDTPEARLALQKLALAVSWRTNQVTPITGIAIVTFALLAAGQRAVTMGRIAPYVRLLVRQARDRNQPLTESAQLDNPADIEKVLAELQRTGVVTRSDKGLLEPVYSIAEGQHLAAAFYRNSMLHFVLDRAIGELALLVAAESPPEARRASFWEAALSLRESLKFEFFFRERPVFEESLEEEMNRINPDWVQLLRKGSDPVTVHRAVYRLGVAHAVLRPFIEAYSVVFDTLENLPVDAPFDEPGFIETCQKMGRQRLLEGELRNPESVSRPLFATGVQLVRNLRLVEPAADLASRRAKAAAQTRAMLRRVDIAEDNAPRASTQGG